MIVIVAVCSLAALNVFASESPCAQAPTSRRRHNPYYVAQLHDYRPVQEALVPALGPDQSRDARPGSAQVLEEHVHQDNSSLSQYIPLSPESTASLRSSRNPAGPEPSVAGRRLFNVQPAPFLRRVVVTGNSATTSAPAISIDESTHNISARNIFMQNNSPVYPREALQAPRSFPLPERLIDARLAVPLTGDELVTLLRDISRQNINPYNDQGETIAHKLGSVSWTALSKALLKKKHGKLPSFDPLARTILPHPNPGSTLSHIIASSARGDDPMQIERVIKSLVVLYRFDQNHFSAPSGPRDTTVWNLMTEHGILSRFLQQQGVHLSARVGREVLEKRDLRDLLAIKCRNASIQKKLHNETAFGQEILELLHAIGLEGINEYNSKGQTVVHELTPVHWVVLPVIMGKIQEERLTLNLVAPTVAPDRYPGATLAHNIAGIACGRSSGVITSVAQSLLLLYRHDPAHFYAASGRFKLTVWDVMKKSDVYNNFLDSVSDQERQDITQKLALRELKKNEDSLAT